MRWLGPWADPTKIPRDPLRREVVLEPETPEDRPLRLLIYSPPHVPPIGSYLVAHGFSPAGPSDPRLDRFLRILAHAGFLVLAPFLPHYTQLLLKPEIARDFERALLHLVDLAERPRDHRPGIFSVSFGSYPALRVASAPRTNNLIGALVVFGGYADPDSTISFNLGVLPPRTPPADRTSLPAVALNLLDGFENKPEELGPVLAGWYEFASVTWGNPEYRDSNRSLSLARAIAAWMEPDQAHFFMLGCGFVDGAEQEWLRALERWGRQAAVDPRPHLHGLQCPVYLFHSRLDDVIPCEESAKLMDALPAHIPVRRYVTGLYGHTQRPALMELLRRAPAMAAETSSMLRMLVALVKAGRSP